MRRANSKLSISSPLSPKNGADITARRRRRTAPSSPSTNTAPRAKKETSPNSMPMTTDGRANSDRSPFRKQAKKANFMSKPPSAPPSLNRMTSQTPSSSSASAERSERSPFFPSPSPSRSISERSANSKRRFKQARREIFAARYKVKATRNRWFAQTLKI